MSLPERWLTLWWGCDVDPNTVWVNADQENILHDAVSAYINKGRTSDWLISLNLTSGGVLTLPVSRIDHWTELTPAALEAAHQGDALNEQLHREARKAILGPDWAE